MDPIQEIGDPIADFQVFIHKIVGPVTTYYVNQTYPPAGKLLYQYSTFGLLMGHIKDHIEKIDFQEIFIAVVNWPISEFFWAFVCIIR